LVQI
jgi:hypothetical protein